MDKTRREIMVYGHCCPVCYPNMQGMVRLPSNINILICEKCNFNVDDRTLDYQKLSIEELTYNYMGMIRQVLLNTKSDYNKYSKLKNIKGTFNEKRAKKELTEIMIWIKHSKILAMIANLANINTGSFRRKLKSEIKVRNRLRWKLLFNKLSGF